MVFEMGIVSVGILYGYLKPGKEKPGDLMYKGAEIGVILACIFALLIVFVGGISFPLAMGIGIMGYFGIIVGVVYFTILFAVGAILGDFLEVSIGR
ncbi:MAG: hypothetical protein ACE5PM_03715 [Candidatus Hydrothermarchaeales archaeon]